jgi:hypothetical protein
MGLTRYGGAGRFGRVWLFAKEVGVKALYNNRLCNVVETSSDVTLADDGREFTVSFGDEALVVDPTDKQVAEADNFSQWYELDDHAAEAFRAILRGESIQ